MMVIAMVMMMAGGILIGNNSKASAAVKCYTILSRNTTVYSNTGLTKKYGTIFGSDQITVNSVTDRYCKVTYPISRGTKTGYISTSAILTKTTGNSYRSRGKITTYTRPGGGSYGYVAVGDTVKVLGTYGGYTQVKYPVSGGYKYAFITTANYNSYIKPVTVVTQPVQPVQPAQQAPASTVGNTAFQMPLTNARCTWSSSSNWSWANNRGTGGSRVYHLGIDIAGASDAVMATAAGTVAKCGYNSENGNYVALRHSISGSTVYSFYAHLSSYQVRTGATVAKGSRIGTVGNSGRASQGKHLHFAMMNALWSGSYYGYATYFSGNKTTYGGVTYYNPVYVIQNGRLP